MGNRSAIVEKALREGRKTLSEYESKEFLKSYGIPATRESLVHTREECTKAAHAIGYPLVLKACSPQLAHKTEKGLVRLDLRSNQELILAFDDLMSRMEGNEKSILVQELIKGTRELVAGMTRDPQFGPCVMFGLGGIFTEILKDIAFRVAPLEKRDALDMTQEIKAHKILGAVRGMPAADMDLLCDILVKVGEIGLENESIQEIDINPLILSGAKPVAVDALIVLKVPG
ncbi:MAG TPA: acetate--CoA ligase family protein [Desulfatiglandales bacterium]|nr:acetate--CoA ligase family protein [Desulfatiglandales bacterium]